MATGGARALIAIMLGGLTAGAALAIQAELPVLGRLEAGLWQLRSLEGGRRLAAVCLGERWLLAQLRHRRTGCTRTLVGRSRDRIEVRYSCPGAFGQTSIRVETPRLARIQSQGVDNGVPFGFRVEARRVGPCR